jgi:hypothetical protein
MTSTLKSNPWSNDRPQIIARGCDYNGCLNNAHLALRLRVPAEGYDVSMHEPMKAIIGVCTCVEHFHNLGPADVARFLTPAMRKLFVEFAKGKAPPDFRRAFVEGVNLHNPDWISYVNRMKRTRR